jgi:hypothetical protein
MNEEPAPAERISVHPSAGRGLGENLVFVVGCPRSGTTWVQRLLGMHPKVRIGQESFLFANYVAPQLRSWRWEQRREHNPGSATGRGGVGLSAYLREEQFLVRLKEYADRLLEPALEGLGPDQLFVDKSPTHARCIAEIKQLYPGARFVHVLRDPRDVAASWQAASRGWGRGWAKPSVKAPVRQWLGHVGAVRESERWLHTWDFYEVVYERLSAEPVTVLRELVGFLGLVWDAPHIADAVERNGPAVLRAGGGKRIPVSGEVAARTGSGFMDEPVGFVGPAQVGTWRRSLSAPQKVEIWYRARKAMRRERYAWSWRDWLPGSAGAPPAGSATPTSQPGSGVGRPQRTDRLVP